MRIPDYPAPDGALDGTELLPIWGNGKQRSVALNSVLAILAALNPNFVGPEGPTGPGPTGTAVAAVALSVGQLINFFTIATPVLNAPSTATTGGTLAAGTYYYRIAATGVNGETLPSNEVSQVTTGSTSVVTLGWTAIDGAAQIKIYRGTAAGAENVYFTTSGTATSFTDTGGASSSGSPSATDTTGGVQARLADASVQNKPAHAFASANAASGAIANWSRRGVVPGTAGSAFAAALWLSETVPGGVQTTVPATVGHLSQYVGLSLPGVGIDFYPQPEIYL